MGSHTICQCLDSQCGPQGRPGGESAWITQAGVSLGASRAPASPSSTPSPSAEPGPAFPRSPALGGSQGSTAQGGRLSLGGACGARYCEVKGAGRAPSQGLDLNLDAVLVSFGLWVSALFGQDQGHPQGTGFFCSPPRTALKDEPLLQANRHQLATS